MIVSIHDKLTRKLMEQVTCQHYWETFPGRACSSALKTGLTELSPMSTRWVSFYFWKVVADQADNLYGFASLKKREGEVCEKWVAVCSLLPPPPMVVSYFVMFVPNCLIALYLYVHFGCMSALCYLISGESTLNFPFVSYDCLSLFCTQNYVFLTKSFA